MPYFLKGRSRDESHFGTRMNQMIQKGEKQHGFDLNYKVGFLLEYSEHDS